MAKDEDICETKPHFFKVLLPGFSEKMLIPPRFTKHIARQNRQSAAIISPIGRTWHVNLKREGRDLFFGDGGWKEFAQAHDFSVGFFLLFRYDGDMVFSIRVFDWSCCEKVYSKTHPDSRLQDDEVKEEQDDNEDGDELEDNKNKIESTQPGSSREIRKQNEFMKIIRASHLHGGRVVVPKYFCRFHGLTRKHEITLKDMKERSWVVQFLPPINDKDSSTLGGGWIRFSKENKLEVGDRCIFQLVSKNVMRVRVEKGKKH